MPLGNGQDRFQPWQLVPPFGGASLANVGRPPEDIGTARPPQELRGHLEGLREWLEQAAQRLSFEDPSLLGGYSPADLFRKTQLDPLGGEQYTRDSLFERPSSFQGRLTGPIKFLVHLLHTWRLDATHARILLGFESDDARYVVDVLNGYATLRGRDAKDRIGHLFQIRKTLSSLFRNEDEENAWLRESHTLLGDASPMDLLLDGSMEKLLLVREYVETVAGK
jgi:hypothetical protein